MRIRNRQVLDVANKTRSNLFGWRVQFTPGLANAVGVLWFLQSQHDP